MKAAVLQGVTARAPEATVSVTYPGDEVGRRERPNPDREPHERLP